jgi:hypothetical protein
VAASRFVGEDGDVTKRTSTMPARAAALKCVKSQPNGFFQSNKLPAFLGDRVYPRLEFAAQRRPHLSFASQGSFEMKVYALRTCHGQWAACSDEGVLLAFESYDEATCTARNAVFVSNPSEQPTIGVRRAHPRTTETRRMGGESPVARGCVA